jgi:hypothetical protein
MVGKGNGACVVDDFGDLPRWRSARAGSATQFENLAPLEPRRARAMIGNMVGTPPTPDSVATAPVHCSFCEKSQYDVRKIIAGPGVHICDECIDLCSEVLERESESNSPVEKLGPASPTAVCPLCNLPKDATELRAIEERSAICVKCIAAVCRASDAAASTEDAT